MKFLSLLVLLSATLAHADTVSRFSCNDGKNLLGSQLRVYSGSWFKAGAVKYTNPLPTEYEWAGTEATLTTDEVKEALAPFGQISSIRGSEFLKGSHKFVLLQTKLDAVTVTQVNKIYIEEELLDGRRKNGLVVYTRLTEAKSQTEKLAEVALCERLIVSGEAKTED